jgi:large conductance mechanosensitive channel
MDYVAFLGRDNVIEVALGLIIGAGFSNLVTSLVADIILPPISLLSAHSRNLESRFLVLRKGQTHNAVYNTIEQAAADGQLTVDVSCVDIYRCRLHGLGTIRAKGRYGFPGVD